MEGQLTWLVHLVGAIIRGRLSSSSAESQVISLYILTNQESLSPHLAGAIIRGGLSASPAESQVSVGWRDF